MAINCKITTTLAFSSVFLTAIAIAYAPGAQAQMGTDRTQVITNGPRTDPGDESNPRSVQQNVRDGERYEHMVSTNPGFRLSRISKECGPINDRQLHDECVASFRRP